MTTTTPIDMTPASPPPPLHRLRRSRTDRVGAGVAGGLGAYFRVDPVLFRVLFATAAFFGGAGLLAYLLAWAAIPEEGTERAAVDGWVTSLRRRRVPFWLIVAAAAVFLWVAAFSWWAPGAFLPVIVVVIVLVTIFGRRARQDSLPAPASSPVDLTKDAPSPDGPPAWVGEARSWIAEAREARRNRRARAVPVKIATLVTLVVTMVVLAVVDAAHGIAVPVYFWFALAILGAGLVVGLATRRGSWVIALLLVPTIIATVGLGGTKVSLRDGVGQSQWRPTTVPNASYKLAFGQGVLDLRSLPALTSASAVRIDQAGGQVQILAPRSLNLQVVAHVRFGAITVDGHDYEDGTLHSNGVNITRTIVPLDGATGPLLTVDVHLADGNVDIRHEG